MTGYVKSNLRYILDNRKKRLKPLSPKGEGFNQKKGLKIGQHGVITADQAREEAKIILGDVCKGSDPSALCKDKRAIPLFAEFSDEYLRVYAKVSEPPRAYAHGIFPASPTTSYACPNFFG